MRYPLDKIFITQPYGANGGSHKGVDLRAKIGTMLYATSTGDVYKVGFDPDGYGNYIVVRHWNPQYVDLYAHLQYAPAHKEGSKVKEGQEIGVSGNTGNSTGPHLHYEVFDGLANYLVRRRTNPLTYLATHMDKNAEKYEGETIIVPEDKGKWYWVNQGKKIYIPDHMTGWSFGLLPGDAKGVTKAVADSIPDGGQLKYWDGKNKRLIDDIYENKKYLKK